MESLEKVIKQKCKFIGNSKNPTNYIILTLILTSLQILDYF